jgi:hypothetical protein
LITFLIVVIWFFVVLPYIFRRIAARGRDPPASARGRNGHDPVDRDPRATCCPHPGSSVGRDYMALASKCLAPSNKSSDGDKATKKRTGPARVLVGPHPALGWTSETKGFLKQIAQDVEEPEKVAAFGKACKKLNVHLKAE